MRFIEALNLINLCVKHKVLAEMNGGIAVYRNGTETSPEGWYLERKEDLAQELMHDHQGIKILTDKLQELKVETDSIWYPNW